MARGYMLQFAFGTEDFDFDRTGSRLLVSAQERRSHRPEGSIWAVPITGAGPGKPYKLTVERGETKDPFHPVGISLLQNGDEQLLFVINRHNRPRLRAVEVFEVHGDTLKMTRPPLRSDHLINPNDILAVSRNEIYISNDAGSRTQFGIAIERVLRWARGNVIHYDFDSNQWKEVASAIEFPNGFALSSDGRRLFIAATMEKRIRVYSRRTDGELDQEEAPIELPSHPDNLLLEEDDRINVACHGNMWALLRHMRRIDKPSPSEVYRLDVDATATVRRERLFADDGREISGASTALVIGGRLYISQLMGNGIYVTELP